MSYQRANSVERVQQLTRLSMKYAETIDVFCNITNRLETIERANPEGFASDPDWLEVYGDLKKLMHGLVVV